MSATLPSEINKTIYEQFKEMDREYATKVHDLGKGTSVKSMDKMTFAAFGAFLAIPMMGMAGVIPHEAAALGGLGAIVFAGCNTLASYIGASVIEQIQLSKEAFIKEEVLKTQFNIKDEDKILDLLLMDDSKFKKKFPDAMYTKDIADAFEKYEHDSKLSNKIKNVVGSIRDKFSGPDTNSNLKPS